MSTDAKKISGHALLATLVYGEVATQLAKREAPASDVLRPRRAHTPTLRSLGIEAPPPRTLREGLFREPLVARVD